MEAPVTSDLTALLAAIIINPDEDTPRLMYADALESLPTARVPCPQCDRGDTQGSPKLWMSSCRKCDGTGEVLDMKNAKRAKKIRDAIGAGWWPESIGPTPEGMVPTVNEGLPAHLMGVFHRGFFSSLECPANAFLAHADELIWHPTQTTKCEGCNGFGWVKDCIPYADRVVCRACNKDGRVPRPVPPTAQPIRKVKLATQPGVKWGPLSSVYDSRECQLIGGTRENPSHATKGVLVPYLTHPQQAIDRIIISVAAECFPGVEFELPA